MDTIVYQSFRNYDVPAWLESCLASVRDWAREQGYEYRFIGDEIFDLLPAPYRAKAGWSKCLLSDLARLICARNFLNGGYQRTIWVDADVLVLDKTRFVLPREEKYYFCNELWVEASQKAGANVVYSMCEHTNNAVTVMERGNSFLDFYIDACLKIVASTDALANNSVGTKFLTGLSGFLPLNKIASVGMFNNIMVIDLLTDEKAISRHYAEQAGSPILAANLCLSSRGEKWFDLTLQDWHFERVIETLLSPASPFR